MAIATGDILRVATRLLWHGASDMVNVFWLEVLNDNGVSTSGIIDAAKRLMEQIYGTLNPKIDDLVTYEDINVSNFTKDEVYGSSGWPTLTAGGGVSEGNMPQSSVFCYFPTTQSGVQGRKWFGGFQEVDMVEGVWLPATLTTVLNAVDFLLTEYTDASNSVVLDARIPHFFEDNVELVTPEFIDYSSAVASSIPGTRSSRRVGAGS